MNLEKEWQTKWNPNYSSWCQQFSSIWVFRGEVKSNIILEKFAASKQPFLITENAFKIKFSILKFWLWECQLSVV